MSKTESVRACAARILTQLQNDDGSLDDLLLPHRQRDDFPLLQELSFGTARWFHLLQQLLAELLERPLKAKDRDLHSLLLVGIYQLRELNIAEHAAINETVKAALEFKKPWAKGLVNAVLRNYQRRAEELNSSLEQAPAAVAASFPDWLYQSLASEWPDNLEQIVSASNSRPPMTLRANSSRQSRADYLTELKEAGLAATAGEFAESAVYLEQPAPVASLPGFSEGRVSVQDEASQLAPFLLKLQAGQRVLDACAAPGGKTCAILESEQSLTLHLALDKSARRTQRIEENLARLQLAKQDGTVTVLAGNAMKPANWWDKLPFQRILLDAPCSATGVIRRHPDIKMLRKADKVEELAGKQLALLEALWPCLETGGLLLYSTCSLLRSENEEVIAAFLQQREDAKHEAIEADWGVECRYGRQLLPGTSSGPDGFYYALLSKS